MSKETKKKIDINKIIESQFVGLALILFILIILGAYFLFLQSQIMNYFDTKGSERISDKKIRNPTSFSGRRKNDRIVFAG